MIDNIILYFKNAGSSRVVFIVLLIIALALIIFASLIDSGIKKCPARLFTVGYRIFYTDQKVDKKNAGVTYGTILYSPKYDIQGKPDYIFKSVLGRHMIPVELKSGSAGDSKSPHRGDMLQLAAYFIIIQDVYKVRPKYGKLIYRDCMFIIKNTFSLRRTVLKEVASMRAMLKTGKGEANPSYINCRYCICKGTVCKFCDD